MWVEAMNSDEPFQHWAQGMPNRSRSGRASQPDTPRRLRELLAMSELAAYCSMEKLMKQCP